MRSASHPACQPMLRGSPLSMPGTARQEVRSVFPGVSASDRSWPHPGMRRDLTPSGSRLWSPLPFRTYVCVIVQPWAQRVLSPPTAASPNEVTDQSRPLIRSPSLDPIHLPQGRFWILKCLQNTTCLEVSIKTQRGKKTRVGPLVRSHHTCRKGEGQNHPGKGGRKWWPGATDLGCEGVSPRQGGRAPDPPPRPLGSPRSCSVLASLFSWT